MLSIAVFMRSNVRSVFVLIFTTVIWPPSLPTAHSTSRLGGGQSN
jgi:hypothetical protein